MEIIVEKKCGRCTRVKPIAEFRRRSTLSKAGEVLYIGMCRACEAAKESERSTRKRESVTMQSAVIDLSGTKVCACCAEELPRTDFRVIRNGQGRRVYQRDICRECENVDRDARRKGRMPNHDLVPAYYPDPLHRVARDWRGPVTGTPSPSVGMVCNPWRMAA
jgi:hypothetical protein